jgi:hypothetical protein
VFPTLLPAIYCVFLVTIHESFQLVNYHIFSNFGTLTSSELPDGDGGAAAEVALFGAGDQ